MKDRLIELIGITKVFPGVIALDDVSFDLFEGEVHVLMGENGAGKSTLMKIIDGIYKPEHGEVRLFGKKADIKSPKDALEQGIAMIHQELNPVLEMTIAENIYLGREPGKAGLLNRRSMNKAARETLKRLALELDPDLRMKELTVAQMQMVEIAKAISYNSRIIIMDEPTSAISDKEADALFDIIRMLKGNGAGIIYISHKMNEIFRIADRITILRDGKAVDTRSAAELDANKLIALMVGREISQMYPPRIEHRYGEVALEVTSLTHRGLFENISFSLRKGEVLGIAGLMGAGRSELVETIFGMRKAHKGAVSVNNKACQFCAPNKAIKAGIALVTEDRKHTGLNLKSTVKRDMSIVTLQNYCRFNQVVVNARENAAVDEGIQKLNIKTPSRNQMIDNLSGGNQQKVILARWLMAQSDVFILDEPTRGIDVGAKYEIYSIIMQLAAEGKAVLMVSSEMSEIIGICDRVLVMHAGRVTGELNRNEMTQENIMALAAGIRKGGEQ